MGSTARHCMAFIAVILLHGLMGCSTSPGTEEGSTPSVIFIDYVEDETLAEARKGFVDALSSAGFSEEKKTVALTFRNAQSDQPTLLQIVDYAKSAAPDLIATNTTLAMINTVKRIKETPVFMMVAPSPELAGLVQADTKAPSNLFGVYETLAYIDTSALLIPYLFPNAKVAGAIFSQGEPQSVDALKRIEETLKKAGIALIALPVSHSGETQLITETLLAKGIDVFFALPDNVIFSSFETVVKSCTRKGIPIVTSEAGLVARGALASFGADMYQWGFQSGLQAAQYLKTGSTDGLQPEIVAVRKKVMNAAAATQFGITPDSSFVYLR